MFKSSFTLPLLHILAAVAFTAVFGVAAAKSLSGEVVGLADGDTLTVLDDAKSQHKVRLAGIDAPEKKQTYGSRSRQSLSAMVFRKHVVVDWKKTDRYGRIVGKVLVGEVDAGLEQVARGMAWHYKAYVREQSAEDRTSYAAAEEQARSERRGLWREPQPTAPWEFRRSLAAHQTD
ncbi:MAG TPA: thermonuclease family protein [Ideonella sp.]|uniref:thermonuclease family protein n=1 Tax=Ideonella sp. TaxID=1929293 RepID=UPI002B5C7290|nr:thermonuclease family protein [Ideonella sp.]HSI49160.1 thermonuclease family protein [Ideonella sp.]